MPAVIVQNYEDPPFQSPSDVSEGLYSLLSSGYSAKLAGKLPVGLDWRDAQDVLRDPAGWLEKTNQAGQHTTSFETSFRLFAQAPAQWDQHYALLPDEIELMSPAKQLALRNELGLKNAGRQIFEHRSYQVMVRMFSSVLDCPAAAPYFHHDPLHDVTALARFGDDGTLMKAWYDILHPNRGLAALLILPSAGTQAFSRQLEIQRLEIQDALARDIYQSLHGNDPGPLRFICVSSEAPYHCSVHHLDRESTQLGREQYRAAVRVIQRSTQEGHWPMFSGGDHQVSVSSTLRNEIESNPLMREPASLPMNGPSTDQPQLSSTSSALLHHAKRHREPKAKGASNDVFNFDAD
ncbi:hypothetical protein [Pseudomonas aeruginosa]|uniref:hypothetical protein n=1 Tax=Pseudomonas aeruginosa TaxID=287 RepID=UPI0005B8EC9A|nr:hypothetical protein [Pseudomonas aeruginosa]